MNRAYLRMIINDEGNEEGCNGDISCGIVHMKGLGSSKILKQDG